MHLRQTKIIGNRLCIGLCYALILYARPVRGIDASPAKPLYQLIDLGLSSTGSSRAYSINSAGDIVLQNVDDSSAMFPHVWRASSRSISHLAAPKGTASWAYAINNKGVVAGYITGQDADHACLWNQGKRIELGKDPHAYSQAYALNNAGDVVGVADLNDRYGRAFLWKHGKMIDLGTLSGGNSCAYGINDRDEVVGYSLTAYQGADYAYDAMLWRGGKMTDLGIVGVAYAINNHGQVVGVQGGAERSRAAQTEAFSWQDGKATLLGTLGGKESFAYALNDNGEIVGASTTSSKQLHAVLWRSGMPLDLNTAVSAPGWELVEARGINAEGQIAGVGLFDGKQHGFLLTPTSNRMPSVPAAEVNETKNPHIASNSTYTAEQEVIRRRIDPVKAVFSKPVTLNGVECQTIVQAVWPLPKKNPDGNLAYHYPDQQKFLLARYGQTNLLLAMRFTNRSGQPLYLRFSEPFVPQMQSIDSARKSPITCFSRPPNIEALYDSPLIAPGQSFTFSRPARLAWYGDHLRMECFSADVLTHISGLEPGTFTFQLSYNNEGSEQRDSVYKTLDGSIEFNKVTITIR